jgi:hypothetical protein
MVLVKVLKRRDASSVVVAILIAMILSQPLNSLSSTPAAKLLSLKGGQYVGYAPPNVGIRYYIYYVVWALLQLIILEILAWIYIWTSSALRKR